jgi:hypothetical protein
MLVHRRPYVIAEDDGRLLSQGVSFGDESKASADVVVVPVLRDESPGAPVLGLASIQSYAANSYTEEHVRAFQWTARSVAIALAREREDELDRQALGAAPDPLEAQPRSVAEIVGDFSDRLRSLKLMIDALAEAIPSAAEDLRSRAEAGPRTRCGRWCRWPRSPRHRRPCTARRCRRSARRDATSPGHP